MERLFNFISQHWRLLLIGLGALCLAYVLLFHNLGGLTPPQYSASELSSQQQSNSLKTILHNPVDAPYKALVWIGLKLGHHSILVTRVAAALYAVVAGIAFYWIVALWYSKRVAVMGTLLFVCSSGFLHFGRYGTGLILQMAVLVLIASVLLYQRTRHETLATYFLTIVLFSCLYIPGMIWLEIVGVLLLRSNLIHAVRKLSTPHVWLVITCGITLTLPLVWSIIHDVSILRTLLGLPASLSPPDELLKEFLHFGSSIVYRGYWPSEFWLHAAPLLTIAEIILFIAGLAVLFARPMLRMNYFVLASLLICTFLIPLRGSAAIAMVVPLIYVTIAGGLFYILDQWLTVFPRNPIAKFSGVTLVSFIVFVSVFYHLRAYFIAWPHAPETKAVYIHKQPT